MKKRKIILVLYIIICIVLMGWAWLCYMHTLVEWWWIVLIDAVAAVMMWPVMRAWWSGKFQKKFVGFALHCLLITTVFSCSIMCGNYYGAFSFTHESVTVTDKYSEIRTQRKRISRRVYGEGQKYRVYFVNVMFGDGFIKTFSVTNSQYNKLRKGSHIGVDVGKGLFGLRVVKMCGIKSGERKAG